MKKLPPELKPCRCRKWKEGVPQLEMAQWLAHDHGMEYTAGRFRYCPWCGKKRDVMKTPVDDRPPHIITPTPKPHLGPRKKPL